MHAKWKQFQVLNLPQEHNQCMTLVGRPMCVTVFIGFNHRLCYMTLYREVGLDEETKTVVTHCDICDRFLLMYSTKTGMKTFTSSMTSDSNR